MREGRIIFFFLYNEEKIPKNSFFCLQEKNCIEVLFQISFQLIGSIGISVYKEFFLKLEEKVML